MRSSPLVRLFPDGAFLDPVAKCPVRRVEQMANIIVTESATADGRHQDVGIISWGAFDELDQ